MSRAFMNFNLKTVKILIRLKPSVFAPEGGKKELRRKKYHSVLLPKAKCDTEWYINNLFK